MTRKEAIEVINNHLEHWKRLLREKICDETDGTETISAFKMAIKALEQEPKPNKGEWVNLEGGIYYCPFCQNISARGNRPNFCDNCGADMRGDKE